MTLEQIAVLAAIRWHEKNLFGVTLSRPSIIEKARRIWPIAGDDDSVRRVYVEALDSCYVSGYIAKSPDGYFMSKSGRDTLDACMQRMSNLIGR